MLFLLNSFSLILISSLPLTLPLQAPNPAAPVIVIIGIATVYVVAVTPKSKAVLATYLDKMPEVIAIPFSDLKNAPNARLKADLSISNRASSTSGLVFKN